MTPEEWRQIAQQNIFPGESGGDYNALFGYSNRDGGRYGNTRLTDMTVNQALDFSNPSGDYGQWVKGQVGHVATPMGAYQVVGRTLRAAQQGLGLTGDEQMTPEMQDRIGQWIYQNQGPSAWEGWRGDTNQVSTRGGDSPTAVAADTRQQLGFLSNESGQQMAQPQEPQGILGMLGLQRQDPEAGGQTAQKFYQRDNFKNALGNLAVGFNSMRLNPDQAIPQMVSKKREGRQQERQANRTADWLRSQPGGERFAELVGTVGAGQALQAYQAAQQGPDQTSGMQNYQFMIANGIDPAKAMERAFGGSGTNVNITTGDGEPDAYLYGTDAGLPAGWRIDRRTGVASEIPGGPAAQEAEASQEETASTIEKASSSISLIDDIMNDPALPGITGMVQGRLPPMTQEGTNLNVKIEQLKGQAFLNAFESLKGGGQITEREGAAATAAMARLERAQDTKGYIEGLSELRYVLDRARVRANGGDPGEYSFKMPSGEVAAPPASGGTTLTFNPETGAFD